MTETISTGAANQAGARIDKDAYDKAADFLPLNFDHFYLQPMAGPQGAEHWHQAVAYCLAHPRWRLSLQSHKIVGIR